MCCPTWETHIPSNMCSPSWETQNPSDMWSSTWKTHIPSDMCSPTLETHIPSDKFSPTKETNIPVICVPLPGNGIYIPGTAKVWNAWGMPGGAGGGRRLKLRFDWYNVDTCNWDKQFPLKLKLYFGFWFFVERVYNASCAMCIEWAKCQLWNVHGFALLPPQMCGCYNFFPWEQRRSE